MCLHKSTAMLGSIFSFSNAAIVAAAVAASEVSVGYKAYPWLRQVVGLAVVALTALGATRTHDDRDEHTLDPRLPFTRIESLFNVALGVVAALHPLALALGVIIKLEMRGSPDKDDPSALTGLYELVAGYGIGTAIPDAWVPQWARGAYGRALHARAHGAYRSTVKHKSILKD